jgi:hypothetical protein
MKRISYLLIGMCFCITAKAQLATLGGGDLLSSSQQFIKDAVTHGLFAVHRCYQLQDTTVAGSAYFGWNNLAYFGDTYSLGVKVRKGYCIGDMAAHPWAYDEKYEEYRTQNRFKPLISENYYREINDTVFRALPLKEENVKEISANQIYLVEDTCFHSKGFEIDNTSGTKKGWIVWVIVDGTLQEKENAGISFSVYRNELVFEENKEAYNVEYKSPASKSVLGGIYVLPENTAIGEITFRLCGYLHKDGSQWKIVRCAISNGNVPQARPASGGNAGGLTPLTPAKGSQAAAKGNAEKDKKDKK